MATVSENARQTYADADEFIQYQIEQTRSRIKSTDLLTATALTALLMVSYVLIFTLFDHWIVDGGFRPWTRATMLAVVVALCGIILYRFVFRPWMRSIHPLYAARMLDNNSEGLQGSLLTLIDLQTGGRKSEAGIQKILEKRAAVRLTEIHVDEAIDRKLLVRLTAVTFVITAITCLYAVLSPKSISLLRPLTFVDASVATRTVIEAVQPGNLTLPAGSNLEILADLSGVIPENVQVLYTTEDRRFVDEPLPMRPTDDPQRFRAMMIGDGDRGIRQSLSYRVVAGDATSETYSILIDQPPTAQVVEVRYTYPEYMNLPDRTDASGTIEAWEDSTVTILAESSVPVQTAILQLSDDAAFKAKGEELPMKIQDRTLSVQLTLEDREDGTLPSFYRIQVFDAEGHSDPDPVVYAMEIRRDQPPVVKLLDPTRDLEVAANAIVPLLIEAEDPDFVLRTVTLHYSVNGKPVQPSEILLDTTKVAMPKRWMQIHEFRLQPLNLNPGDVVTYHVQARDNRPPLGNQGRTGELNLQITAPLSEQAVQDQLELDREMQKHQMKERDAGPDPSDPSEAESADGAESQPSEMPSDDETTDRNSEESAQKNPDETGDNARQQAGPDGQPSDQQGPGREPTASEMPQDGSDSAQPGQQGNGGPSQKRRLEDDEALQKLIEGMNRNPQDKDDQPTEGKNTQRESSMRGNPTPESAGAREPQRPDEANPKEARPNESDSTTENSQGTQEPEAMPSEETSAEKPRAEGTQSEGTPPDERAAGKSPVNRASEEDSSDSNPGSDTKDTTPSGAESLPSKTQDDSNDSAKGRDNKGGTKEDAPKDATAEDERNNPNSNPEGNNTESGSGNMPTPDGKVDPVQKPNTPDSSSQPQPPSNGGMADDKGKQEQKNEELTNPDNPKTDNPKTGDSKAGGQKSADTKTGAEKSKSPADSKANTPEASDQKAGAAEKRGSDGKAEDSKAKSAGKKEDAAGKNAEQKKQSGDGKSSDGKSGDGKSSDGKSGDGKSGDGKSGDGKSGDGKSGDGKSGDGKSGDGKSGDGKSGDGKSGDGKSGDGKSGDGKSGDGKSGDGKSGDGKSGDGKSGDGKSGDGKSGDGKSGDGKSGDGKSSDGKSSDGKSGDGKSGDGKSGDGKSGDGKSGDGKSGDGKSGDGKSGDGKSGKGEGKAGKGQAGQGENKSGAGKSGPGKTKGGTATGAAEAGSGGEAAAGQEMNPGDTDTNDGNGGGTQPDGTEPADSSVDEAAEAAGLALRRLQKDLDRGEVDPKLLEELGWTKEELSAFKDRLQKQLEERKISEQEQRERSMSQKSFEEMLKSLDVKSTGKAREGRSDRDRDQQDTTNRQPVVPKRYQQWYEMYQRSISEDSKPRTK